MLPRSQLLLPQRSTFSKPLLLPRVPRALALNFKVANPEGHNFVEASDEDDGEGNTDSSPDKTLGV